MLILTLRRTNKTSGDSDYLVDKAATDRIGRWSPDVRFAQICDDEVYDTWEFENDDRRSRIYDFTYELVKIETDVHYIITSPKGWIVVDQKPRTHSRQPHIDHSKILCSIIEGGQYEEIRRHFDAQSYEQHVKTRIFPF